MHAYVYFQPDTEAGTEKEMCKEDRYRRVPPDDPESVRHLDRLRLGETTLELHIHSGTDTCNDCEPGLVKAKLQQNVETGSSSETGTMELRN